MTKEPVTLLKSDINASQAALRHGLRSQWLVLALALAILAGVIGYHSFTTRRDITNQEHLRLQTQARVIALNIERQLEATNLALTSVIKDVVNLRPHEDMRLISRHLQTLADAMPGIRTMFVLDAEGNMIASNREELIGRNFRTRDYFATPTQDNNPSLLYVSPPFKTVLGSFLLNVSRVIPAPNGGFNGVVSAALDPEHFQVLLSSVLYAPDMWSAINHGDGIRFMMVPGQSEQPGKKLAIPGTFFTRHRESGRLENVLTGKSVNYDSKRVMALRTVQPQKLHLDKPLYVACSRNYAVIYENWRSNTLKQSVAFVLISVAACFGLILLQRRQREMASLATRSQDLLHLRLSLMEYAATHDMQDLLRQALDEVCSLSNSPIGFYHFVEPDQKNLSLQAWSTRTLNEFCTAKGHGVHYPIEKAGVWADCVRQRRPLIHNDYASLPNKNGLPEGHAPVVRELVVPILRAEQVVAIMGIGNKPDNYTDQDIELVAYLADVVWEITERKRSEEDRYELGIRYQTLQSVARDGIHIVDMDGNLVESNAAFRQMLGYADTGDLQLNITEWDAAIPRNELITKLRELIHEPATFETRHRRCDGTIFDAEVNACGVRLGDSWYLYASSRDISKRKEMDASLRESRQLQADIFDFLPDATFVIDLDKKVIAWNKAMEEMSGVAKEDMLGQGDHAYTIPFYGDRRDQLLDLIDIDDDELTAKYQRVTRLGGRLFGEAFCPALYNGKGAHVWAIVAPLYDSDGKRIGAIESIRDITAIKEAEANLARSNRELEQFAYVASHDLQEPLRKIAGFTELLANRYKGTFDEKGESYMAYIVDGATRMRSLINDLLSYSRVMRSNSELAETDSSKVLSRVLRDLELIIQETNAEITCGPLPVIQASQSQLGQLFQNLIGNAIKYRGVAAPKVAINAVRQRNNWLFSVTDNGIGIAPEFYERIFTIFQRLHTRTEYPGTGIGLAVCQKIVERHGGKIWVESTIGRGSTFFFTIPLTDKHSEIIR
ncbi:MAG: GAF domain-containing protein [Geobacteraceae bacterium]|nr:GAF domain-containing protein [Geobacteraceae bacterium]